MKNEKYCKIQRKKLIKSLKKSEKQGERGGGEWRNRSNSLWWMKRLSNTLVEPPLLRERRKRFLRHLPPLQWRQSPFLPHQLKTYRYQERLALHWVTDCNLVCVDFTSVPLTHFHAYSNYPQNNNFSLSLQKKKRKIITNFPHFTPKILTRNPPFP